jgi:hypothetical protein
MVSQFENYVYYCSFVVAAVQSEETESWGAIYAAGESGIPVLQPAFFAADQNER